MPYRRLPNTNQARLRSIRQAVHMGETANLYDLAYSYKLFEDAKGFLTKYQRAINENKQCSEKQFSSSVEFQEAAKNARMYVSHFVKVLNMCVQRREIRAEYKEFYGLRPDNYVNPDLTSDESLYRWGKKIIEGEQRRLSMGGTPIYNPAIAKVRVHYDIFAEFYGNQKILQNNTSRTSENIGQLNKEADELILKIWDEVEATYADQQPAVKIEKCKEYGLIYYYRKGETI
ncbi:MAG: hypothetical protein MJZ14_05355 [Paludibacteraceae bacterium]|nr:hypothetical protein [Paludibacteraceae bacterium]